MLSPRQARILSIIVNEYVDSAAPVGSEFLARTHRLGISAATVRNEMAALEEEGYITHPHTSAGRIPSDRGYRYYVEALMEEAELDPETRLLIRHQFRQVEAEEEAWIRLAAAILARVAQTVAIVTFPHAPESRLRRLELVSLQDFLALLILVLQEAQIKQHMLALDESVTQDELTLAANKLNALFAGKSAQEMERQDVALSALEGQVKSAAVRALKAEDAEAVARLYYDGLRHALAQPEFASGERTRALIEALEDRGLRRLLGVPSSESVSVIIGSENAESAMRDYSVVSARYGTTGQVSGTVAVLGPTRMRYQQVIPMTRYVSGLMTEIIAEICQ